MGQGAICGLSEILCFEALSAVVAVVLSFRRKLPVPGSVSGSEEDFDVAYERRRIADQATADEDILVLEGLTKVTLVQF
jgi:hypothetical protein